MKLVSTILGVLMTLSMFISTGNAAILISFGAAPTFFANSGVQSIDVFANSTLVDGEVGAVLGADFTLGGGAVFNSPNAGTFGGPGFIGNDNINSVASTFDRDTIPALANTGYLNITFTNFAQTITNTPARLATLLVDTSGLASGNYSISVSEGFFGGGFIADTSSSFNITAVPEPGSIWALGICLAGLVYRQRRSK
jgi:hypothetical protein